LASCAGLAGIAQAGSAWERAAQGDVELGAMATSMLRDVPARRPVEFEVLVMQCESPDKSRLARRTLTRSLHYPRLPVAKLDSEAGPARPMRAPFSGYIFISLPEMKMHVHNNPATANATLLASLGVTTAVTPLSSLSNVAQLESLGDATATGSSQSSNPLLQAIGQALTTLGLTQSPASATGTAGSSSASDIVDSSDDPVDSAPATDPASSTDPADTNSPAMQQFIGALFQALSSIQQGASSNAPGSDPSGSTNSVGSSSTAGYNSLAAALNALAQAVESNPSASSQNGAADTQDGAQASSDSETDSSDVSNDSNTSNSSNASPVSTLEQDFNNLFGSNDGTSGTSLQAFLQTLAGTLNQGSFASSGSLVQASA
jgi:hypothetical protein